MSSRRTASSAAGGDAAARTLRSLASVHKQIAGLIRQTESAPVQAGGRGRSGGRASRPGDR
ncbi:MAG: hypothetical protein IPK19_23145 [Chloroflexi bacterium]|nr:hypothetical protein [Chloroflexota bacterium]